MPYEEPARTGEFLLSEAEGTRSRERVTVAQGHTLQPGTVLGVIAATGEYAPFDPTATDGTETAAGVLYDAVDSTGGIVTAVALVRDAEIKDANLIWPTGITDAQKAAAAASLRGAGLILR